MLIDPTILATVQCIIGLAVAIIFFVLAVRILKLIPSPGIRLICMAVAVKIVIAAQGVLIYSGVHFQYSYINELWLGYCVFIIFGSIQFSFWLRKKLRNENDVE